jgi:hypothetical protein
MAFKREVKKGKGVAVSTESVDNALTGRPVSAEASKIDVAMQRQIIFILTSLANLSNSVTKLKRQVLVVFIVYALLFAGLLFFALVRSM